MTVEQERAAFETFSVRFAGDLTRFDDTYKSPVTHIAWIGWLGRAQLAEKEAEIDAKS